jgi:hypothetical protein
MTDHRKNPNLNFEPMLVQMAAANGATGGQQETRSRMMSFSEASDSDSANVIHTD